MKPVREDARLLSALRGAMKVIETKDKLLVCYRLGSRPSESLFKEVDKNEKRIDKILRAIESMEGNK